MNRLNYQNLSEVVQPHCISIYSPTDENMNVEEMKKAFRKRLGEALVQLLENGIEKSKAHQILEKGFSLLHINTFWMKLSNGLAVFLNENRMDYYLEPVRFKEMTVVGSQFFLHPLRPLFEIRLNKSEVKPICY